MRVCALIENFREIKWYRKELHSKLISRNTFQIVYKVIQNFGQKMSIFLSNQSNANVLVQFDKLLREINYISSS